MSINAEQMLEFIISPAIDRLGFDKTIEGLKASKQLMLLTLAQESLCGKYIKQVGGPANGVMQIEPNTHTDVYVNYLKFKPQVAKQISIISGEPDAVQLSFINEVDLKNQVNHNALIYNLIYSVCIARVIYYRSKMSMPKFGDIDGMWLFYKSAYNSNIGAAKEHEFKQNSKLVESAIAKIT